MKKVVLLVIFLLIGMSVSTTGLVFEKSDTATFDGNTLYVGGNGPGNYTKIQDAIDDASEGDTVFVYDDSSPYVERIAVEKSINLIGENKDTTIIETKSNFVIIELRFDNITISGFTLKNTMDCDYGIFIHDTKNHIIYDNIISETKYGIDIHDSTGNHIYDNNFIFCNYGLYFRDSKNNEINENKFIDGIFGIILSGKSKNNTFNNNELNENGIDIHEFSNSNFFNDNLVNDKPYLYYENENDLIFDNIEIGQLTLINCDNITMKNLEITYTSRGVLTINSNNCFYYNNSFHSNKASGIKIVNGDNIEIINNSIFNNFYGIIITGGNDICDNNKIISNHIFQNDFSGILIDFSSNSIIKYNIIEENGGYQYFSINQAGIDISSYSYDIEISNNLLKNNNIGIIVTLSEDNVITYNLIERSKIKNILLEFSYNNRIQSNNFYDNKNRKYFRNEEMRTNNWNNNYWENWIGFGPKLIWGDKLIERWGRTGPFYIPITWFNFDWHPAQEPYDIGV